MHNSISDTRAVSKVCLAREAVQTGYQSKKLTMSFGAELFELLIFSYLQGIFHFEAVYNVRNDLNVKYTNKLTFWNFV